MFSYQFTVHSEVGRIRKNNQDAAYGSPTMLLICDGMGGAAAGDLASAVAATEAKRSDRRLTDPEDALAAIAGVVNRANDRIGSLIEEEPTFDGMGTTFCGGLFTGTQLAVAHIGDSRGYLVRDEEMTQFTHDHSWVQSLIDDGKITPEQAATHPHRSLILKVLNGQEGFEPDYFVLDLQVGDRILFCSDGLSGFVAEDVICQTILSFPIDEAVEELAAAANASGGYDNISIVLAEVVEHDEALDQADAVLAGSATEVAVPTIGALAQKAGQDSGYPEPPQPSTPVAEESTDQEPEESARYAPSADRRRLPGALILLLVVALLVGVGAWGVGAFARSRYFVAPDGETVAIYNGLPGAILGLRLNELAEDTEVRLADLPTFHQRAVRNTIAVTDLDAGRATATELAGIAERCRAVRQQRLRPVDPVPDASSSPSPTMPGLPMAPGEQRPGPVDPGYPTLLAPITPTATAEADPESC